MRKILLVFMGFVLFSGCSKKEKEKSQNPISRTDLVSTSAEVGSKKTVAIGTSLTSAISDSVAKFDFGDDCFDVVFLGEGKISLSHNSGKEIIVELNINPDQLKIEKSSDYIFGLDFYSQTAEQIFIFNKSAKKIDELFFDMPMEISVRYVDFINKIIIGDTRKSDKEIMPDDFIELYLFSSARQEHYKISENEGVSFDVKRGDDRKIFYKNQESENIVFDYSELALPLYNEIIREVDRVTILKTFVKVDSVQPRRKPSYDAENNENPLPFRRPLYVIGTFADMENKWLCCTAQSSVEKFPIGYMSEGGQIFWLTSDSVLLPEKFESNKISFSKILTNETFSEKGAYCEIEVLLHRADLLENKKVLARKMNNQDFYTFVWNEWEGGYNYSDLSGTYIWNPKSNEIKLISFIGNSEGSYEKYVSNDFEYVFAITDDSYAPCLKNVNIINSHTGDSKGRWDFYKSLDYDGDSIVIGDAYYPQQEKIEGAASEDSVKHAKEFEASHEKSDEEISWGDNGLVYVKYRLSLEDFSTEFIGCEYVKGYAI